MVFNYIIEFFIYSKLNLGLASYSSYKIKRKKAPNHHMGVFLHFFFPIRNQNSRMLALQWKNNWLPATHFHDRPLSLSLSLKCQIKKTEKAKTKKKKKTRKLKTLFDHLKKSKLTAFAFTIHNSQKNASSISISISNPTFYLLRLVLVFYHYHFSLFTCSSLTLSASPPHCCCFFFFFFLFFAGTCSMFVSKPYNFSHFSIDLTLSLFLKF